MKKLFILTIFGLLAFSNSANAVVFTDPAVLAAILQQTATQTSSTFKSISPRDSSCSQHSNSN